MKFNETAGAAIKTKADFYKFENGENKFRMVGEVIPRYVYWKKTIDGSDKNMSVECLGFNREEERFDNIEKDWFQHYFPQDKCSWSYLVQVFDPKDNKLKVLSLKKKLFGQILDLAKKHLGDATDPDDGWEVVVERTKDGPLPFNVSYQIDQLACKKQPLTEEQKETLAKSKTIFEQFPRPTSAEQKIFVEKVWFSQPEEKDDTPDEVADVFDDDINI